MGLPLFCLLWFIALFCNRIMWLLNIIVLDAVDCAVFEFNYATKAHFLDKNCFTSF